MKINAEDLMENRKVKNKRQKNKNGNIKAVVIAIVITFILIVIIAVLLMKVSSIDNTLKVFVDGKKIEIDESTIVIEGDKVYLNVKKIAPKLGYRAHSGEYKIEEEDDTKVFVENENETASMFINSKIISKIEPNSNNDYKNYEMSENLKDINGNLYIISDGIEIACNVKVIRQNYRIDFLTIDELYRFYKETIEKEGYTELNDNFENKKAILYERLVVKNSDDKYGVIDLEGNEVIGTRYSDIKFDEYTKEFKITNQQGKRGIDSIEGKTKISVKYEELESISKDNELYLVKNNNKYGIIDGKESPIIHIEYDSIGVDISPYINNTNKITNENKYNNELSINDENKEKQYIFFKKIIPVEQNGKYGFFDIKGNIITDIKYKGIGCYKKGKLDSRGRFIQEDTKTTNNILVIEEYNSIIVEGENGYGVIDESGMEKIPTQAKDIYYVINAGEKIYYLTYGETTLNIETDIFDKIGMKKVK